MNHDSDLIAVFAGPAAQEGDEVNQNEVLAGLKAGRKLRCDRKDEPLLPWLLAHPNIDNRFVQADEQSSYIEFRWRATLPATKEKP
jgi:hypothetical protein